MKISTDELDKISQIKRVKLWGVKKILSDSLITEINSFSNNNSSFWESLYRYINQLKEKPTCINCKQEVQFKSYKEWYQSFCSSNCRDKCKSFRKEVEKNKFLKKYGVEEKIVISYLKRNKFKNIEEMSPMEQFYIYNNNLIDIPKCKICIKKTNFQNWNNKYWEFCSHTCKEKDSENFIKGVITKFEKQYNISFNIVEEYIKKNNSNLEKCTISEKFYLWSRQLKETPTCKSCWKILSFTATDWYPTYCSLQCKWKDKELFVNWVIKRLENKYKVKKNIVENKIKENYSLSEKYYLYSLWLSKKPICKTCNKELPWTDSNRWYWYYCSNKCIPFTTSIPEKEIRDFIISLWISEDKI